MIHPNPIYPRGLAPRTRIKCQSSLLKFVGKSKLWELAEVKIEKREKELRVRPPL
jgi:hypothetical protein